MPYIPSCGKFVFLNCRLLDIKMNKITLGSIFTRFKWRISFTFSLVIIESLLDIFFPLLIGIAINDLLDNKLDGIYYLVGLGGVALIIGSARRFYDTRIYSTIYKKVTVELVQKEFNKDSSTSKISARSDLMTEFVDFLEESMPAVIDAIIGLIGIVIIIASLNLDVFWACMGLLVLVAIVYVVTGELNFRLNTGFNNQLEKQVQVIESKNIGLIGNHFKRLMKWNIHLSDLETVNYFVIWVGVIMLLAYTPVTVIESGVVKYGLVFAILMYVFDYIEKLVTMPLFIQQLIRLKEISVRFNS